MIIVMEMFSIGDLLGWIIGGFFLLLILLWLLFIAFIFVASRFEKIRFDKCSQDLPADEMPANRPRAVGEAMDAGLELVRTIRSTESNLITGYEWDLASPDRTILNTIGKSRFGSTFSFISRRSDGVWLITKQAVGTPLRVGRRVIFDDLQTSRFLDTLNLHRLRLREASQIEAFDPARLDEWTSAFGRAVYEDLIDAGMASWVDATRSAARLTLRGSFRTAFTGLTMFAAISRNQRRAPQVAREAASLPPLGLEATSAPTPPAGLPQAAPASPVPSPAPLRVDYVVITRRMPNGAVDYLPYTVDSRSYLPVFTDETQANAYNALYPPAPGETRTPIRVSADWLRQCLQMGYALTLNPHLPTRAAITPAHLALQSPQPA